MKKSKIILCALGILCGLFMMWATCVSSRAGCGVVEKTLNADNILFNYEWFHDVHNQVLAKTQDIKDHKGFLKSETDKEERTKLRIELTGMKQVCRSLVQKYNANSQKLNRSLFRENSLPVMLYMEDNCQ